MKKYNQQPNAGKYSADSELPMSRVPMEPAKTFGYSDYNTRKAGYSDYNTRKAGYSDYNTRKAEESAGTGFSVSGVIFGTTHYVCMAVSLILFFGVIAPSAFKLLSAIISS